MAEAQIIIDEEFQPVREELDLSEEYFRNIAAVQRSRRTQIHAIELAQEFCDVHGRTINEEPPKRKPRVPRKMPGRDKPQVELEKFEDVTGRLGRMTLTEHNDSDREHQQYGAVAGTSSHNPGYESHLTENAPEEIEGSEQTNFLNFGTDYHEFGLRICENSHYFPGVDGQCPFCGGYPVDKSIEFQSSQTDLDLEDEDDTFWEDKADEGEREEFGLLICRSGHVFHKTMHVCNICGMRSTTAPRYDRNANKARAQNDPQVEDEEHTLGNFYMNEPVFFANGWLPSWSTTSRRKKNKRARLGELMAKVCKPNVPVEKVDVACAAGSQFVPRAECDEDDAGNLPTDKETCSPKPLGQFGQ